MRVAREEIFGPVVSVIRFADEDEAVRIANAPRSDWSHRCSLRTAIAPLRVSRQIRAGAVFVNNYHGYRSVPGSAGSATVGTDASMHRRHCGIRV